MDKKEEELLSMHYQMEKTDIKQQKFEDRLLSISEDLRKSKRIRNRYFISIIVLILIMVVGSFYVIQNDMLFSSEDSSFQNSEEFTKLLRINDSLQQEVIKLRTAIINNGGTLKDGSNYISSDTTMTREANESLTDSLGKSKLKFEKIHSYVTRAFKSNGVIFIDADFVEYYQGRSAVKKAKEFGEAEYDIDKKGDTLYYLYNNHYIHNQNSVPRILELDDKVRLKVDEINQFSSGFPLKAFQKIIKNRPVLILETNNGVVYKITQQKLL